MTEQLRCRLAGNGDAAACASWLRRDRNTSSGSSDGLAVHIKALLGSQRLRVLLVEGLRADTGDWDLLACSFSAFVQADCVDAQLETPHAFLLDRLVSQSITRPSVLLDVDQVAAANTGRGLDLLIEYMQASWDMTQTRWREVAAFTSLVCARHHRGYRLNRILQEGWAAQEALYLDSGLRVRARFDAPAPTGADTGQGRARILCYCDRDEAMLRSPGLPIAHAFQYAEPRCRFTAAEQRVLARAIDGLTDQEIASELATSVNAVRQSWRTIYQRLSDHAPFVLGGAATGAHDGKRGPEKRRRVIAYVEANPQELRPYRRDVASEHRARLE